MEKLENFSWKRWHIVSLVLVTVLMIGGIWTISYLNEAAYVVRERNYEYVGRGQRLLEYQHINEEEAGIPLLALSFAKEDKENDNVHKYAVGYQFIAMQDSKLFTGEEKKKDANEYFRIRYYRLGYEKGEGHTIDVLKLVQERGYDTIEGGMRTTLFTDGKGEYVGINVSTHELLFVNLNKGEIAETDPTMIVGFDYSGLYQILYLPDFETEQYSEALSQTSIGIPWISYNYKNKHEEEKTSSSSSKRMEDFRVKGKDTKLFALLKKYRHLLIFKPDITMEEYKKLIKSLFPDADDFSWYIGAPYTKSGQEESIQNAEEFQEVIKEENVEKEMERRLEEEFKEGPDDD